MSEASQWTELLLRKQQMDATAQASQDAAWRDSVDKLGQAGGRLAAGLADQDLLKFMGQWNLQGIIDKLSQERARRAAAAGQVQGTAPAQPQAGFQPSGLGAMPAQNAPQPRPSPGPAVITVPPSPKVSYGSGMIIRNPETGERLQWGGSEWMPA